MSTSEVTRRQLVGQSEALWTADLEQPLFKSPDTSSGVDGMIAPVWHL